MNISLRIIFVSSILLALTVNLNAQGVDAPKLKEIKGKKLLEQVTPLKHKKGLWGYANDEGKYVIKPVFTEACPFEGNLARVNVDGKWGTISSNGLFIVEPIYESIAEYSADSLAVVNLFSKYGLINAKGQHIQTNCYEEIQYADYGYRGIQNGKYNTLDSKGAEILPPQFDDMVMLDRRRGLEQVLKDGQWGVLQNGRDILADGFDDKLVLLQSGAAGQPDLRLPARWPPEAGPQAAWRWPADRSRIPRPAADGSVRTGPGRQPRPGWDPGSGTVPRPGRSDPYGRRH